MNYTIFELKKPQRCQKSSRKLSLTSSRGFKHFFLFISKSHKSKEQSSYFSLYSQNLSQIWQKSLTRHFTSESTVLEKSVWESSGSLVVRIQCSHCWVQSLVKELRSYKQHSCRSVPRLVQLFLTPWTAACQASQSFTAQRGKKKKKTVR